MNMTLKDVNVLERLLPNQNLAKESTLKQVDAGFKNIYEDRVKQNGNTAYARLNKQSEKPDDRVKARLENAFDKKEVFASRVKEKRSAFEQPVNKMGGPEDTGAKLEKQEPKDAEIKTTAFDNTPKKEAKEVKKPEELEKTDETKEIKEHKSPLMTFMQMILNAIEEMSPKLSALKEKMDKTGTLTPEVEAVFDQLASSIAALKTGLSNADQGTMDISKTVKAIEALQTFNETIKDILKSLPTELQAEMSKSNEESNVNTLENGAEVKKTSIVGDMKAFAQELKQILHSPIAQIQTKPLLEKLEHVEGKSTKWIEQEIKKLMDIQKTQVITKDGISNDLTGKGSKETVLPQMSKAEVTPAADKREATGAAEAQITATNKTKSETTEQRNVHLEQVGTPIDKQIIKLVERTADSQNLFKSILSQVEEGVKASFKVLKDSSEMVMKLKPENLGDVSVKISVHKNSVIAEMTVQSQIVKQALESSLMDLKNTLKDKGFDVTQINVNVGSDQNFKESNDSSKYRQQTNRYSQGVEALGAESPLIDEVKAFIQNGRMDYFA